MDFNQNRIAYLNLISSCETINFDGSDQKCSGGVYPRLNGG
ncbi:hypothetical protein D1AOALGA4SA_2305 [Olavius algarvensis Delta 1 endosymbiont]|nr:hypothetical protein D1AOALGA4SA_2305 [Olavius algarvensis Delta 1 endosymbiont]